MGAFIAICLYDDASTPVFIVRTSSAVEAKKLAYDSCVERRWEAPRRVDVHSILPDTPPLDAEACDYITAIH